MEVLFINIQISQIHAQLEVERSYARLDINTQPSQLEIRQKHARLNIQTELPKVHIDQYECFAEAGLKNVADQTRESAQLAYRQAMDYIAKTAQEGDQLAAVENGGNAIIDISERNAYPVHEFNIDCIPKSRPKIEVTGSLKIEAEPNGEGIRNGVEFSVSEGRVNFDFTPSKVKIYMKRYPETRISYVGSKVDVSL